MNKNNPANFISVDEKGITTHSVGRRLERGADGVVRDVNYDSYHQTYEGYDKEKLKQLARELHNPIILSAEGFPLVRGITKTGEAVLSQDFVEQYKKFIKTMEERGKVLTVESSEVLREFELEEMRIVDAFEPGYEFG